MMDHPVACRVVSSLQRIPPTPIDNKRQTNVTLITNRVINIIVIDLPSWLMGDFAMIRWRMIDDNGIITNSSVDRRDEILCRVDKH